MLFRRQCIRGVSIWNQYRWQCGLRWYRPFRTIPEIYQHQAVSMPTYYCIRVLKRFDYRGAFLTAALGLAICPWKLLTGSNILLAVLSSFSVFLGPLTVRYLLSSDVNDSSFECLGHHDCRLSRGEAKQTSFDASVSTQLGFHLLFHVRCQLTSAFGMDLRCMATNA